MYVCMYVCVEPIVYGAFVLIHSRATHTIDTNHIIGSSFNTFIQDHTFISISPMSQLFTVHLPLHSHVTHTIDTNHILNKSENATLQLSIFCEKVLDKKCLLKLMPPLHFLRSS